MWRNKLPGDYSQCYRLDGSKDPYFYMYDTGGGKNGTLYSSNYRDCMHVWYIRVI